MTKAILFDLDGTLLPMDYEAFLSGYFRYLCENLAPHGYQPKPLIEAVWAGTTAMIRNDGSKTNETVFWDRFAALLGERCLADKPLFELFYQNEFQKVEAYCRRAPEAAQVVARAREKGVRTILATNPIFPAVATQSRMRWAGLSPADFELYTTYENIGYSKPNPAYYREILRRTGLAADECLMVGNDVDEDMVAGEVGMRVFLLTDCLINKMGKDISSYPQGNFADLLACVENL